MSDEGCGGDLSCDNGYDGGGCDYSTTCVDSTPCDEPPQNNPEYSCSNEEYINPIHHAASALYEEEKRCHDGVIIGVSNFDSQRTVFDYDGNYIDDQQTSEYWRQSEISRYNSPCKSDLFAIGFFLFMSTCLIIVLFVF